MNIEMRKEFALTGITEDELCLLYTSMPDSMAGIKYKIRVMLGYEPGGDAFEPIVNPHLRNINFPPQSPPELGKVFQYGSD